MDQQRIKQLIDLLAESDLSEMTLSEGGTTLTLSRQATVAPTLHQGHAARSAAETAPLYAAPASAALPGAGQASPVPAASQVCSPLYGVLHLTPSPEEPAFVSLGASVTVGQTLCIVEAMKMFHQVKASQAGRIDAILAQAGDEVESGQALFSIV